MPLYLVLQKPLSSFIPLICFVLAASLSGCSCWNEHAKIARKPILKINGTDITTQQFSDRLATEMKSYDSLQAKDEANLARAKERVVQALILETIERIYAAKASIAVSKEDVDRETAKLRSVYPDENAFRRALADENLPYEEWKHTLAFTLLQKKIYAAVTATAPLPSDQEIREYYETNKAKFKTPARVQLRQIVLAKEDNARRILQELSGGGDFAKLAKQYSIAPEGENGGNTGWIEKGTLDIFDTAFKMPLRSRSKILQSPYGYHIFEVLKKEPEAHLSFNEAKAKIRALLKERIDQKAFSTWLEEQVHQSKILRDDALIRAIKVSTQGD